MEIDFSKLYYVVELYFSAFVNDNVVCLINKNSQCDISRFSTVFWILFIIWIILLAREMRDSFHTASQCVGIVSLLYSRIGTFRDAMTREYNSNHNLSLWFQNRHSWLRFELSIHGISEYLNSHGCQRLQWNYRGIIFYLQFLQIP